MSPPDSALRPFAGRVALVTGAARGIGRATAARLTELGCRVAAVDRDEAALAVVDESVAELAGCADVTRPDEVEQILRRVVERFGRLDVLVNNAALAAPRRPPGGLDLEAFAHILAVNTTGAYVCTKIAARHLAAAPGGGAVVNVSSVAASRAFRHGVPYAASKGALEAATRAFALDLAPEVRVNAVAPAMVATEHWDAVPAEEQRRRSALVPLRRPAQPQEVAEVVCFLAGPPASYLTGQVVPVDGGLAAQAYTPADEQPLMEKGE